MSSLFARFRNGDNSQGIRQSTALTTVYLLEMNRKFESFMRDKVEELEGRVAAQQARLSTRADVEEIDWEDTLITEEEATPIDELEWRDVVPIVDVPPEPSPALAMTEEMTSPDVDGSIFDASTPEQEPEPEEPAAIPDYMTLLVGEPANTEPEPATEPVSAPVGKEELAEGEAELVDDLDDPADEPEFALATEIETADEADAGDNIEDISPTDEPNAASIEDNQPVDEGISVLDLLAEGVTDTIPWFDEEQADRAAELHQPVSVTPIEAGEYPVDENEDESDAWDAALPAEGQKGQWV